MGSVSSSLRPPNVLPMSRFVIAIALALVASGCGLIYKQPIYQGTLVKPDAVNQLQVGMARQQVAGLLGTPAISDPFHHQRWDYTATRRINRAGGRIEVKNLTLWFENDRLTRWEGDYFPDEDLALSQRMRRFGNLPREKGRGRN